MISCLIVSPDISKREEEAEKRITSLELSKNHPNLLWLSEEEKLGISEVRHIQEFLSLKPYQGKAQAVVILTAEKLTEPAQNALLKTLEEPNENVTILLGVSAEDQLLPTILSRCSILNPQNTSTSGVEQKFQAEIEKLIGSSMEERFKFVEKLEEREEFLHELIVNFRHKLLEKSLNESITGFLKDLLEAERWAKQKVTMRAILEYLMLKMPQN
ncbi:hypothetical protein A2617_02130 [Candidatus Daviesbacteria bacterium RIFOXYD1_FULL_41_10]|uniref:DNA polymerase III subunit delta n=1 Tax=Candidatus Daviesbacteria bacterium RIFOXYD1_FULL_41_10 TaxID=1797801 RepID=A0A1F5N228_9BACT|nr:MAG: hypothetical protein A2617_02130 [Candidatus Daviesbacteria bacterium RIFOXYD1_FULL_41_10]